MVSEERPVDNPKPMARPVDVRTEEPRSGVKPVDDTPYERMPRNGPIADPRIAIGPVTPITNELTPRDEGCDNQTNIRRPDGGDGSVPTTGGRPDTGPQTIVRPQGGRPNQSLSRNCTKHLRRPKCRIGWTGRRCP